MSKKKLVHGVGINDTNYKTYRREVVNGKLKTVWSCPFYSRWVGILQRCYSEKFFINYPSYRGCTIVEEWLTFSKFRAWMETQPWEGKELDKDILFQGNKIYGPDTCVFVTARVNTFLGEKMLAGRTLPIGVTLDKNSGKYKAECQSVELGRKHLGLFDNPEDAHKAWLAYKLKQAYIIADQQSDERVAKALIDRYENYGNLPKAA